MTLFVCSMTAEASDAKKYSTSLSSKGWNSEVDSVLGSMGSSLRPCGLCSKNNKLFQWTLQIPGADHNLKNYPQLSSLQTIFAWTSTMHHHHKPTIHVCKQNNKYSTDKVKLINAKSMFIYDVDRIL